MADEDKTRTRIWIENDLIDEVKQKEPLTEDMDKRSTVIYALKDYIQIKSKEAD